MKSRSQERDGECRLLNLFGSPRGCCCPSGEKRPTYCPLQKHMTEQSRAIVCRGLGPPQMPPPLCCPSSSLRGDLTVHITLPSSKLHLIQLCPSCLLE